MPRTIVAAVSQFEGQGNFSLNANGALTVVNFAVHGQANVGKGDVIVWSGQAGGFIGVDFSAVGISADAAKDRAYYGRAINTDQMLMGSVYNPGANGLRSLLPG